LEKICNILLVVILVITLVIAGIIGIPQLLGKKVYSVLTGSMEPTYPVGSIVFVENVNPDTLQVGDVITFSASGFDTLATHRITGVDVDGRTLNTKGDGNNAEDIYPVEFENVIGRVFFSIPFLGLITSNLRTTAGMLCIVGLLMIVFILFTLPELSKKTEKK